MSCFSLQEQPAQIIIKQELTEGKSNSLKNEMQVRSIIENEAKIKKLPLDFSDCGLNNKARNLARLIVNSPEQQRLKINCNLKLAKIAAEQAKALANAGVVDHYLGGSPNQRLVEHGFNLPDYEKLQSNTLEAILGGEEFAENVWLQFQTSFGHKRHLLGEHEHFAQQTEIGVGHFYKWHSPHVDYWVIYISSVDHQE